MDHGIEIILENKQITKDILKNDLGIKKSYSKNIISIFYNCNMYDYNNLIKKCIKKLEQNNIKYLIISI